MVDRGTVYAGQIPLETDLLKTNKNAMVGVAKISAAVLGSTTIVNGFTCIPTGPASLNVIITAGEVYQLENIEQSSWSSLPTDTHTILKQGIILDPVTFGITPPGTVGFSQNFLVEVQYQDLDSGATVLPYFNAANPTLPFSGPGNAGTAQNTVRQGIAALQVKAGTAAATGTQTTPTADAGWTGMFVVTVANGAATITSGNISQLASAPFIPCTLPNVPTTSQAGGWTYGVDSGTPNNYVVTLSPVPPVIVAGMNIRVKMLNAPTGASVINVNATGNKSLVNRGGVALQPFNFFAGDVVEMVFDGTNWQIIGAGGQPTLIQNLVYYVSPTGNDSNNGLTVGAPFLTWTHALAVAQKFNTNGFNITIQSTGGLFSTGAVATGAFYGGGNIILSGDTSNPNAHNITVTSGSAVRAQYGAVIQVQGLFFSSSDVANAGITAQFGGEVDIIGTCNVGACAGAQINGVNSGQIRIRANMTVSGNSPVCLGANSLGTVLKDTGSGVVITISGAPAYTNAFATADRGGFVGVQTLTFSGAATGSRYASTNNAIIDTGGGGASFFPGSSAGSVSNGGIYL